MPGAAGSELSSGRGEPTGHRGVRVGREGGGRADARRRRCAFTRYNRAVYTVFAGGVGASRFLQGLVHAVDPPTVTIISNTGDYGVFWGLYGGCWDDCFVGHDLF